MNNQVIIDSSILIEYLKGNKSKLLLELITDSNYDCCITETIISEYLFYWLKINGGVSPLSLQSSSKISLILRSNSSYDILQRFIFCASTEDLYLLIPQFMSKYNLLPNDAIILATCKIHNITKLASHDTDFTIACQEEGIQLIIESV